MNKTNQATLTRILKTQQKDMKLLKILKHTNGVTMSEIIKITNLPHSYLKNALKRLLKKELLFNKIEINQNRIRYRWYINNLQ